MAESIEICDGCPIPRRVGLFTETGIPYHDDLMNVNTSCSSGPGTVIFDGTLTNKGTSCVYHTDPRATKIVGQWVLSLNDIRLYRTADDTSTDPGYGFCHANLGAWVVSINCNGATACDATTAPYPIWVGLRPFKDVPGQYTYIKGSDRAAGIVLQPIMVVKAI